MKVILELQRLPVSLGQAKCKLRVRFRYKDIDGPVTVTLPYQKAMEALSSAGPKSSWGALLGVECSCYLDRASCNPLVCYLDAGSSCNPLVFRGGQQGGQGQQDCEIVELSFDSREERQAAIDRLRSLARLIEAGARKWYADHPPDPGDPLPIAFGVGEDPAPSTRRRRKINVKGEEV